MRMSAGKIRTMNKNGGERGAFVPSIAISFGCLFIGDIRLVRRCKTDRLCSKMVLSSIGN
jgi:hypothetical protein